MRLTVLFAALIVLICVGVSPAQFRNTSPAGDPGEYLRNHQTLGIRNLRGLLDPSRMHMSHEVSFGYANMGGRSATQGLYMNHMDYQIAGPLMLTTHLGYQFQPSGPAEWNPANNGSQFVGGADLNWRPTENTNFRFSFYRNMYPGSSYSPYGWGNDYYRPYFVRP
jgi:hypothetical protein